jgi:uncharacterized protein with von Willebrand factor type A (vWA) domain
MTTNIHFFIYLAHFFLESETFRTKFIQKIKTHFVFIKFLFFENSAFYEKMWKNNLERGRPWMTYCMLDA